MPSKMLIDAAHPEETRVVVVKGTRVEEFDYESANKKQLRGNIYLAKVTRVEPSLQAAFVDYGGNRHGFLAFTEIHPDYYQIPVADRQALLEEEAAEQSRASAEEAAEDDERPPGARRGRGGARPWPPRSPQGGPAPDEAAPEATRDAGLCPSRSSSSTKRTRSTRRPATRRRLPDVALEASDLVHKVSEPAERSDETEARGDAEASADGRSRRGRRQRDDRRGTTMTTTMTSRTGKRRRRMAMAKLRRASNRSAPRMRLKKCPSAHGAGEGRPYKIQEVIRRRQIILVQVVKEERGNKGAALTTYLSLAGRYTVLMPNTARGGGISRKITQPTDRKRLREIAGELEVPEGMGLIIRTAGAQRTKTEIKRDYDYLLRLWETVRDLTLKSTAPALVYEEGSLIKRSIRDLYNKDIDEVLVAGDDAYREAKDFMRMLMPSHAKNVKPYKEPEPVFIRYQVERQLAAMFSPQVTLKSGGYIVINQTEALVSVDVNSGKATREHNIEDTALKTNLEASDEIARQLRLRDLAGLIVIDFIDMDERRNNRHVEKRLKEALRNDRARIQVGPDQPFRPDGNVAPASADGHARRLDQCLRDVPGHRHRALRRIGGARHPAFGRGPAHHRRRHAAGGHDRRGCRPLHPQSEAGASEGHRGALSGADHGHRRQGTAHLAVRDRARRRRRACSTATAPWCRWIGRIIRDGSPGPVPAEAEGEAGQAPPEAAAAQAFGRRWRRCGAARAAETPRRRTRNESPEDGAEETAEAGRRDTTPQVAPARAPWRPAWPLRPAPRSRSARPPPKPSGAPADTAAPEASAEEPVAPREERPNGKDREQHAPS